MQVTGDGEQWQATGDSEQWQVETTRVAGDELTGDVSDRQERCERQAMDRPAKVASDDEVQAMDQPTIGALPDVSSGSC